MDADVLPLSDLAWPAGVSIHRGEPSILPKQRRHFSHSAMMAIFGKSTVQIDAAGGSRLARIGVIQLLCLHFQTHGRKCQLTLASDGDTELTLTGGVRMTPKTGGTVPQDRNDVGQLKTDLAAAFRIAAQFNWHESVGNHFSAAISDDGTRFLMNPRWRHFSTIKASDLLELDSNDQDTMKREDAPDPSAWAIHGQLHARLPGARCILHLHPPYATAVAALADPTIKPIDQNTARFYERIAVDLAYGGIADEAAEGARLAHVLGNRRILMMGNHGVLVAAGTIAEAFEDLYFLERACQTLVLAYSTGQPLNVMPVALAERTARDWEDYAGMGFAHFAELKRLLDVSDSSYMH